MKVLKPGKKASDNYPTRQLCSRCEAQLEVEFDDVFDEPLNLRASRPAFKCPECGMHNMIKTYPHSFW